MLNLLEKYLLPFFAPDEGAGAAGAPAPSGGEASGEAPEASDADAFSGFEDFTDDGSFSHEGPEPAAPAQPPGGTPAPAAVPAPATPPATPPVSAPQPQPSPQAQGPQAPPGSSPGSPPSSPGDLAAALEEHRGALVQALATERFGLSPEEREAMETDPAAAAPQLMARAYYEAVHTTLNHIANMVPKLIEQTLQVREAHEKVLGSFFGKNKALDRAKHMDDVLGFARAFRSQNPQIGQQDLEAVVAAAVMAKYGLVPVSAPNGGGPRQPAFAPAQGGAPAARQVSADTDPWAGLTDMGD